MRQPKRPPRTRLGRWLRETPIDTLISELFWLVFLVGTAAALIYAIAIGDNQLIGTVMLVFFGTGLIVRLFTGRRGRR